MKVTTVDKDLLNKLLELSEAIQKGDYSKRITKEYGNEAIDRIIRNFNNHADKLLFSSSFDPDLFINTISSFINHDFNHKLPISEHGNVLDAIATGINMLGDELEESVVSKELLEEERNRLNQAQAIAKTGSWEYNIATNLVTGSDELYRIYELEDMNPVKLTKAFYKKYHPDDIKDFEQNFKNALENGIGYTYEHRLINNDKSIKYLSGIWEAIKNEKGKVTGIKGTVQDITDRKNIEIELKNTLNIVREQNQRLLSFSHIVSHNLRSHSGNIYSLLDLLDRTTDKKEKDELFGHLKTVSVRLNETMDNLWQVISIQNNHNLPVDSLDLYTYVNHAMDVLSKQISMKQAVVKNKIPEKTFVTYNPAYLESIILNFISNAIKYSSPNRKPLIKVDYLPEKKMLRFIDNGLGIDLEKYGNQLFGMYKIFHLNQDARGLGLFLVKNQVDAMGGRIEVASKVNQGTTFSIYIK